MDRPEARRRGTHRRSLRILHLFLHLAVPAPLALLFRSRPWWQSYCLLLAGMLVDLDHLLADPVYDPLRCSIGFHPLHSWPALLIYLALAAYKRTRIVGVGLLLHMLLDAVDCLTMPGGLAALQRSFLPALWIQ